MNILFREVKQQTFLRSRAPTGNYSRQCEYTARVFTPVSQVAEARTPLLKFKIEREILVLEISRFGKN